MEVCAGRIKVRVGVDERARVRFLLGKRVGVELALEGEDVGVAEFGREDASPELLGVADGKGSSRRLAGRACPRDGRVARRVQDPEQLADKRDCLW